MTLHRAMKDKGLDAMMQVEAGREVDPAADELLRIFDEELETAALAQRRGQKIYQSLRQLSELIGGEYGDRVVYELLQNAHDAHLPGEPGDIAVRVVVEREDRGFLYVANSGTGFSLANVQAVRNIATSTKEIGEGIGNKGVGFRSIEALTSDARIYSRRVGGLADRFDGFCFRFASSEEIQARAVALGHALEAEAVASALPRYLAAVPVDDQPDAVVDYARRGYATVVVLPLETAEAVKLAVEQVRELTQKEAPVLLFLERVRQLDVEIDGIGVVKRKRHLTREARAKTHPAEHPGCSLETVVLGPEKRSWLVVRNTVDPLRIRDAVKRSLAQESGLKRWLDWKGDAVVSLATPLDGSGLKEGRLYNFLPMGPESVSPLLGHLDAPFFTAIDRRRAKPELPLNSELLDVAAEAAAIATLALAAVQSEAPARASVDLAAWHPQQLGRLRAAYAKVGVVWADAPIWPTMDRKWAPLKGLRTWPTGTYKVFTAAHAADWARAQLLPANLDPTRLAAIHALAKAAALPIEPTAHELSQWAEAIAGRLSTSGDAASKVWAPFYAELHQAFGGQADNLKALAGKLVILERSGALARSGTNVYVRQEGSRRIKAEGSPLPPRDVARMLTVLSDQIVLKPETFTAFERAGLWRRYDAPAILAKLPTLFGEKPAPARRRAALAWAYEVWKHDTAAVRKILPQAALHVPTGQGWIAASSASFSGSWTSRGKHLEAFLAEARHHDADSEDAMQALLAPPEEWPGYTPADRTDWLRFLGDAHVVDGLVPRASALPAGPLQGNEWSGALSAARGVALDDTWRKNHGLPYVSHPYTQYTRAGEAWRLPGQAVVATLSDEARRSFAILVLQFLDRTGGTYLWFSIGRFGRDERHYDRRHIRTPIATFLMTQAWVPAIFQSRETFYKLQQPWLLADRRSDPKFIAHFPEGIAEWLAPDRKSYEWLSRPEFGLRTWKPPSMAASRLRTLASVCEGIEPRDRPTFRKQYDLAWRDLVAANAQLGSQASLALETPTGFARLAGSAELPKVYVRSERDRDLTKLLIETGSAVLAGSGDFDVAEVVERINKTAVFSALPVEQGDVQLLCDGEPFQPSFSDPLIVDVVPWLRDALFVAHETGARDFEKNLTSTSLDERMATIRVRTCSTIDLSPADGLSRSLEHYVYRDDTRPTLLIAGALDAQRLSDVATHVSLLVNTNLRSFEPMLLRLAPRLIQGVPLAELPAPSPQDYASALQADQNVVLDLLADRHADNSRFLDILEPIIAYHAGAAVAKACVKRLEDMPRSTWMAELEAVVPDPDRLVELLESTEDIAALRRSLDLDYAKFNQALLDLGRPTLANKVELKRLFEMWKNDLAPQLLDRIRRTFLNKIQDPDALKAYAGYRSLDFLTFDQGWEQTQETLDRDTVKNRADELLTSALGLDPGGLIGDRETTRSANRKTLLAFATDAARVLLAIPAAQLDPAWRQGPSEVAAAVDRAGALDFTILAVSDCLPTLVRVGLWPNGVEQTLDLASHGLTADDLDVEARKRQEAQREETRRRNSIDFGSHSFDTSQPDFATRFADIAEGLFSSSGWRARSKLKPPALKTISDGQPTGGGGGGGSGGSSKPPNRQPDSIKTAMGLAGELLAFQYLKAKHRLRFSNECWVSENRTSLFPEPGNTGHGFDFKVSTSEADWLYEVKATQGDGCEFELTDREYRTAALAAADRGQRYRVLLVQNVFSLTSCRVLELPNPAGQDRSKFKIVGRSSVRMAFELE